MKYKIELSIMTLLLVCLSLPGVASAGGVVKTLYVDGNMLGSATGPEALSAPYTRLTIGAEGSAWYRYNEFAGKIDEFAVYGKDLNAADVNAHYKATPGTPYVNAVMANSPLLYLRFEDANSLNGSRALNSGSADVNGKYIDGVTHPAGWDGNTASFRGAIADANGDCIDVPDEARYLSLESLTVEFWVNTTQATDYPRFFQHNNGDTEMGGYGAMYSAASDTIGLIGGGNTNYVSVTPGDLNDGNWHHVVVTYASTRSYATEVMADDPCVYLKFDNQLLVDSSVNHWFAGYNSGAKIQKTTGAIGLALYLDNTIRVGDPNHEDAAAWTWNNYGGTLVREGPPFQGNDDAYAFCPNDITFEVWVKRAPGLTPNQYAMIFQQTGAWTREPNAPGLGTIDIDPNDPNVPVLRILAGSQWWYPGVNTPNDVNNWHQLVVTYDENTVNPANLGHDMKIQLYVDGAFAASTTIVDDVNHLALLGPELAHIMIGSMNDRGWPYNCWGGYIDEFSIYRGVLSAQRVAAHYAAWQPITCAEAHLRGMQLKGDLNGDCVVDFEDYAIFADKWLQCNDPTNPNCTPNW